MKKQTATRKKASAFNKMIQTNTHTHTLFAPGARKTGMCFRLVMRATISRVYYKCGVPRKNNGWISSSFSLALCPERRRDRFSRDSTSQRSVDVFVAQKARVSRERERRMDELDRVKAARAYKSEREIRGKKLPDPRVVIIAFFYCVASGQGFGHVPSLSREMRC